MIQHSQIPQYWERLSEIDREEYIKIKNEFSSTNKQTKKYKSSIVFSDFISKLRRYVMKGDFQDKNRALVCGIYWTENKIAINTRQLSLLISKCKSSINGSFQALGYGMIPVNAYSSASLIRMFPELGASFADLRQWTFRQNMDSALIPNTCTVTRNANVVDHVISSLSVNHEIFDKKDAEINLSILEKDDSICINSYDSQEDDIFLYDMDELSNVPFEESF